MDIVSVIIGGFLAAGTGWFLDWRRTIREQNNKFSLFKSSVIDDLENSIELYEKIQDEWEKSNIVWFAIMGELRKSRIIFEKYSEYVLFFPKETRKNLRRYYWKSENLISILENFQNRKYVIENNEKQILIDWELRYPSMSAEELEEKIKPILSSLREKRLVMEKEIPKFIGKFESMKNEARVTLGKIA